MSESRQDFKIFQMTSKCLLPIAYMQLSVNYAELLLPCRDGVVGCEASVVRRAGGLSGRVEEPAKLCDEFPLPGHLCS